MAQELMRRWDSLCEESSMQIETALAHQLKEIYTLLREGHDEMDYNKFPLICAALYGYDRLVWGFIESAKMTNTDLHTGQTLDLQKFLAYRHNDGQTALHVAVESGIFEVVKVLLEYVSKEHLTSYRDNRGRTPLYLLKDPDYDEFIFETLKKTAGELDHPFVSKQQPQDYTEVDMDGTSYPTSHKNETQFALDKLNDDKLELTPNRNTILHLISKFGDLGYTKSVLEKHSSLIERRNSDGETPLYVAAREGNMDILEILINHVKDDDNLKLELATRSNDKHTALHIAIENHHAGVVFFLVQEIPKLANCINCFNESPLYLAVERNFYHIFRLLLDECKDIEFKGINGRTAMHIAAAIEAHGCIQDLLREKKDLLRVHCNSGWTPLHYAVFFNNLYATEALLSADFNIGHQMTKSNGINGSAIHIAVLQGHQKQIEALFSKCPGCFEMTDSSGRNILHVAIQEKQFDIFDFILMEYKPFIGDLINQRDMNGNTPYHLLAASDDKNSDFMTRMHVLADFRVNVYARNNEFLTPTDMASSEEKRKIYIQVRTMISQKY